MPASTLSTSSPAPEARDASSRPGLWPSLALDVSVARGIVLVLAVVHLGLAWFARTPGIGWGEDDAQYFNLARDLAQFGYHERWDISAPFHVRYPPLFPALLALVGVPSGWNVDAMLFAVALCSAVAIVVFFDAARRKVGVELALFACVLWALNPLTLRSGGWLLSESLFNLFFAIGLWGITREEEGTRFGVVAGVGFAAAALTRTAGVAMVAGLLAYWLYHRRWKRAAVLSLVAGGTIGLWVLYSFISPESESQRLYSADLARITARAPARIPGDTSSRATRATPPPPRAVLRLATRVERIATNSVPTVLAFRTVPGTIADNLAWLLLMVATGAVGAAMMFRKWLGAALPLATYLVLLMLWTWMMERYFIPIIPLLYLTMLLGASWLMRRFAPRWHGPGMLALVGLFLLGEVRQTAFLQAERSRCDRDHVLTSTQCYPEDERRFLALAQWVRDSTPAQAVFMASKEAAFYTHSGRRVVNQIRALQEDSTTIVPFLRAHGVSHVAVGRVGVRALRHGKLMASACRDLVLVRQFGSDNAVLRVRGVDEPSDGGAACQILAPWRTWRPAPERSERARTVFAPITEIGDDSTASN